MAIYSEFSPWKMVIFHSYVKLPEGNTWTFQFWEVPEEHTSHYRDDFPPGVVLEGDRSNEPTALQVKWGEREKGQVHGGIIPEVAGKKRENPWTSNNDQGNFLIFLWSLATAAWNDDMSAGKSSTTCVLSHLSLVQHLFKRVIAQESVPKLPSGYVNSLLLKMTIEIVDFPS